MPGFMVDMNNYNQAMCPMCRLPQAAGASGASGAAQLPARRPAGAVWRRICEALTLLTGTLQIVPGTSQATLSYPPSGRRARTGPLPGGRAPGAEGHGRGRVYLRGGQQVRAHADMRLVALREAPGTYTTEHRLQPGSCNQDRLGAIFKWL